MNKTFSETLAPAKTGTYANDYLWSTLGDWSQGSLPTSADNVFLTLAYGTTLAVDVASTIASLTFSVGGELLVAASLNTGSVAVATGTSAASVTVASGAQMTVGGALTLGTSSVVQVAGTLQAGSLAFTPNSSSDHSSRLTISAGTLTVSGHVDLTGAGSMSLAAGAVMTAAELTVNGGSADLAGHASLGALQLSSGTLSIEGSVGIGTLGGGALSVNRGGSLEVTTGTSSLLAAGGSVFTLNGGNVTLDSSVALLTGSSFSFGATASYGSSRLDIEDAANFKNNSFGGAISALGVGDQLQFGTATFSAASYNGTTLTLVGSGATPTRTLTNVTLAAGAPPRFSLSTAADGGTVLTLNCFLAGSRIETPAAEIAVESLSAGDLVITLERGERVARPVRRTHSRRVDLCALDADAAAEATPVRIRAHALADHLPARDLLVTGDHGILHPDILKDGALVPARMLVNDASIVRESECVAYTTFHLELDEHAILLSEGLASESYLGPAATAGRRAAPLCTTRALVEPLWERLAERARALQMGQPRRSAITHTTSDPALRIHLDDGTVLRAVRSNASRLFFVLPAGSTGATLQSRSAIPAEIDGPFVDDRRRLGVCVRALTLWTELRSTALSPGAQAAGWHAPEPASDARWTDGGGRLELPTREVPTILEIELCASRLYCARDTRIHRLLALP